jgi:hypothetical protein
MSKSSKRVLWLPIEKRAEIAFKIAVAKAIDEHSRLGLPVYIWRNGKLASVFFAQVIFASWRLRV